MAKPPKFVQIWLISAVLWILQANSSTLNIDHPLYNEVITADYKVQVDAGKQECFYQYALKGALFYVDFNVISGGDGKTGFHVLDPDDQIVMDETWKEGGSYETSDAIEGYYGACIDNTLSIFSGKLVNFYIHTYMQEFVDTEDHLSPEELELEKGIQNLTRIISGVGSRINKMLTFLHQSRASEARDFALLEQNNFYVLFWSSVQCLIIITTGGLHVYFIRKLFEAPYSAGAGAMKFRGRI